MIVCDQGVRVSFSLNVVSLWGIFYTCLYYCVEKSAISSMQISLRFSEFVIFLLWVASNMEFFSFSFDFKFLLSMID